jgi:DNA-binding NarL/FixJ family response regulator
MKLMVIDRRVAIFPVDPNNYERGFLELTQPAVVEALVAIFERTWADAQTPQEHALSQFALTSREQTLVGLLALGHTDASAAREMAISERSVSNIVRALMDRAGVDNRFQLGLVLGSLRATPLLPVLSRLSDPDGEDHA